MPDIKGPKIDVYRVTRPDGRRPVYIYLGSTNSHKRCKDAVESFRKDFLRNGHSMELRGFFDRKDR